MGEENLYQITVDRETLDNLMGYLSNIDGKVKIGVNQEGDVSFILPKKSPIKIKTVNVMDEIFAEMSRLKNEFDKLPKKNRKREDLEHQFYCLGEASEIIYEKIINKKT